jgi:hypothetical protein
MTNFILISRFSRPLMHLVSTPGSLPAAPTKVVLLQIASLVQQQGLVVYTY